MKEDYRLLDATEVAATLNVSLRTVEQLIAEGDLVPVWIRRARRFTPEQVEAYIRSHTGVR